MVDPRLPHHLQMSLVSQVFFFGALHVLAAAAPQDFIFTKYIEEEIIFIVLIVPEKIC
uniref:Uncharacterized protein n=1 Tax=Rhodnius prolixus TaxID=13249 RepID=T1HMM8_RHOPR